MVFSIPASTLSGFRSPISVFTENGPTQTPVFIRSQFVRISLGSSKGSFTLTIRHKSTTPILATAPSGIRLEFPLTCLASILVLNHGQGGRTLRFKLVPSAFELSYQANNRYALDEHGNPIAAYSYHDNDYFNLLGILKDGEFVTQISYEIPMEAVIGWATELKDSKYLKEEGRDIQVLFENDITGRISQIKEVSLREQQTEYKRLPHPFTEHFKAPGFEKAKMTQIKSSESSDSLRSESSGNGCLYSDSMSNCAFKSEGSDNQSEMEYDDSWERFRLWDQSSICLAAEEKTLSDLSLHNPYRTASSQPITIPCVPRRRRYYGDLIENHDPLPKDSPERYYRPPEPRRHYRPGKRRRDTSY